MIPPSARTYIGLATTFHDPAIAIVNEAGEVVFAEATERYLQDKRSIGCAPDHPIRIVDLIGQYGDPAGEFVVGSSWSRRMHHLMNLGYIVHLYDREKIYAQDAHRMTRFQLPRFLMAWMQVMQMKQAETGSNLAFRLRQDFGSRNIRFHHFPHHDTHAAYACAGSPFDEAACVVVDGLGEASSLAYYRYSGGKTRLIRKNRGLASLGFFYKQLTHFCGFDWVRGEEWKVMGLAPYGKFNEDIAALLRQCYHVRDGALKHAPSRRLGEIYHKLGAYLRPGGSSPEEAADLAHTGQRFFADLMEQILLWLHGRGLSDNLVVSGGCALNSSFNGTILARTPFKRLHVPSAPADDGNAVGAALLAWQRDHPERPLSPSAASPYLGSEYSRETLENVIRFGGLPKLRHLPGAIHEVVADLLIEGKIVGWFQGRAEFGPRALGNRSILADPRPPGMKDKINELVKFREAYRPFAPSILHEHGPAYFEDYQETRHMERTLKVRPEMADRIPAVVHVDGTGRLQTVKKEWNERFHALVSAFHDRTGVPVVLNTSFNVMGKPIVHSVEDALATFHTCGLGAHGDRGLPD
jgi:carbamoyltransferase